MNEILDDFEKEPQKNVSKTFSRLAFGCAMMSLTMFVYFISSMFAISVQNPLNPTRDLILTNGIFFICLAGTIFSVFSYIRAEPMSIIKIGGALINFTFMGMLLFSIYFANFT